MEGLRWILLILGILLVAGIYGFDRYKRRRSHRGVDHFADAADTEGLSINPRGGDDTGDYSDALADLNHLLHENRDTATPDTADSWTDEAAPDQDVESTADDARSEERLIVFYLKAPDGHAFAGPGLFEALYTAGLSLGTMGIYHDSNSHGETIFSVANIFEPGTLETDDPDNFSTRGLALFMQLPGPADEQGAFERMLGKAEILSERLGGELQDENHQPLDDTGVARARAVLQ